MVATTREPTSVRGTVPRDEADELVCSMCHEPARRRPPSYYLTSNPELVPRYSHRDGSALCWRPDGGPARPMAREVRRLTA